MWGSFVLFLAALEMSLSIYHVRSRRGPGEIGVLGPMPERFQYECRDDDWDRSIYTSSSRRILRISPNLTKLLYSLRPNGCEIHRLLVKNRFYGKAYFHDNQAYDDSGAGFSNSGDLV